MSELFPLVPSVCFFNSSGMNRLRPWSQVCQDEEMEGTEMEGAGAEGKVEKTGKYSVKTGETLRKEML